jgi:hypothetical protein
MRLLRSVQQTARPGPDRVYGKPADQCSTIQLYFRNTGKPRLAQEDREDHRLLITAHREKYRMECVGKTCCAANRVRRLPEKNIYWSWRRDLNPRPSDYKSDALPTELRQQIRGEDTPSRKLTPQIPARCPGQLFKVSQGEFGAQGGLVRNCPLGALVF